MPAIALLTFDGLLLCAAAWDVRSYRIPNLLPLLLAASGLVLAFPGSPAEALGRAGSLAGVILVGGGLWLRGLLGGGDLKLLMACGLWIPLSQLPVFLLALGLFSGAQGAATLGWSRLVRREPLASAARGRVAYAVSIAAAGLFWSWSRLGGL